MLPDALAVRRHLTFRVLFECKVESDVIVPVSWCHVPMEMKDRLTRNGAIVRKNIESFKLEAFHHRPCNSLCCIHNTTHGLWRKLEEGAAMVLWNDQRMAKMYGPDVQNRNSVTVLIQVFSGRRPLNDVAECAARF
jgi:hypothetical protein